MRTSSKTRIGVDDERPRDRRGLQLAVVAVIAAALVVGCGSQGRRGGGDDGPPPADGATRDAGSSRSAPSNGCGVRDPDDFTCDAGTDAGDDGPVDAGHGEDAGRDDDPGDDPTDAGSADAGVRDAATPPTCPWPEGGCSDRCTLPARSSDPCAGASSVPAGTLLSDAVWDGRYCVEGSVGVAAGVTLTIEPGSEIYFAAGAQLETEGHLEVVGTDAEPILLSGDTLAPSVGHWQGIHVQLTEGGTLDLRDATVEYGQYGVATWEHASDRTYAGPETTVDIRRALLRYNGRGVVPDDNTELTHSTVVCNYTGIAVASEDDPLQQLRDNNVCFNRDWDAIAQQDGADVTDTWWCTTDLAVIEAHTMDERDDLSMGGLLTLEPFRSAPVPEAPPVP